jgi:protocadherin Fat 1/2/3
VCVQTVSCLFPPQARSDDARGDHPRVAHVMVNVTILDINDNCPMFVNLPYYAVVSVDAQKGDIITKVRRVYPVPK